MTEEEKKKLKLPPFAQAAEADRAAGDAAAQTTVAQNVQNTQTPAGPDSKPSGNAASVEKPESKSGGAGWNRIQVGETRSDATSTSGMKVNMDTTGWDKPAEYAFKTPEHAPFKYNEAEGIVGLFKPKEPEYDAAREERLNRIARVNAFGDFVKHLGAFAGGGYAPTEKRGENQAVLRAFNDVDRMREVYDARKQQYDDKVLGLNIQDHMDQRNRHDRKNDREDALAKEAHDRNYQSQEELRRLKADAYLKNNTTQTSTKNGSTSQYKNLDLLTAEMAAKKKAGSGKDESFDFYKKGVGDIKVSASGQIQIGTRITSELLRLGKITKAESAAMLSALKQAGSGSRIAFQSMLDYAAENDQVWDGVKEFIGHGMEIERPENASGGGVPSASVPSQGSPSASGGVPSVPGPGKPDYDYKNVTF